MKRLLLLAASAAATLGLAAPASASIVSFDAGGLQFRAAPGEANRVEMRTGVTPAYPFFDRGATLLAGPGCTGSEPVVCAEGEFATPIVNLGDRGDVAFVDSFFSSPRVFGESGDDDIWSGGSTQASAFGGSGDDTLRLNTDGAGVGVGGPGDDRIGSNGTQQDDLRGESGNDLLASQARNGRLSGGAGRDELVALQRSALSGDAGADVLVAPNGGTLSAGSGIDVVKGHGTIDAGGGTDLVDATDEAEGMEPDTVACGGGLDLVWASAGDVVAADCELVLRRAAPALPVVTAARAAADALLAHRPQP
jgi:hypothetical protein